MAQLPVILKVGSHGDNYFLNGSQTQLKHQAGTLYVSQDGISKGYLYYDDGTNFVNIVPRLVGYLNGGTGTDLSQAPANAVLIQDSTRNKIGYVASAVGAFYSTAANGLPAFGTLPISCGGTGLTASPSLLVNLGSTSAAKILASKPRPGVTGVLGAANGGTGKNNLKDACNALLNALDTGSSNPGDNDYYISQYVNGGTTTTTYHRRPMSALYNYIKGKLDDVYIQKGSGKSDFVNVSGDTMTGTLNFNNGVGINLRRTTSDNESLSMLVESNNGNIININEVAASRLYFTLKGLDTANSGTGATENVIQFLGDKNGSEIIATKFTGILNGKLGTARKISVNLGTNTIATFDGSKDIETGVVGTLRIVDGGTGMGTNPSMLVNLASEAADTVFKASPRPGITGVLGATHGGTGQNTLNKSANALINALEIGSSNPSDDDYFISQYVGGGTSKTDYYRRPMSALYNYLQGKLDLQYVNISGDTMTGNLSFSGSNKDQFIYFLHADNDASSDWRIGHLGTGESNTNYFVIEVGNDGAWNRPLQIGMTNHNITVTGSILPAVTNTKTLGSSSLKWNNIYATTFTGALSGNASTATKLKTARKIQVNLGHNTVASFDGSADIETGVVGLLRVVDGGTGAASHTSGGVLYGQGTSAIKATAKGGTAQILAGGNGTPVFVTPAVSWVDGAAAGPTFRLTINSTNYDAVIPSASGSASGIVTTGNQTFKGVKTFSDGIICNGTATFNQSFHIAGSEDAYYNSSSDYKNGALKVDGGITAGKNMRVDGGTVQFAKAAKIQYDSTKECFNFVF